MMDLRSPLFLGLTRPVRHFGLPVAYFAIWAGGTGIALIIIVSAWVFLAGLVLYVVLRLVAEREPAFFEILAVVARETPRTRNRRVHSEDRYVV